MPFDVKDYVESHLANVQQSAGAELTAECPSCGKWGGFYVNAESGAFVCFKCGFKGKNSVGLVAELEGMSWTEARAWVFKQAVTLRRKSDIFTLQDQVRALRPDRQQDEDEEDPVAFDLPRAFLSVSKRWPSWLSKKRKVKKSTAKTWGLGWCRVGRYAGRLIVPIVSPEGYSFTARDMTEDQEPKYLNPKGADHRRLLIGWNLVPKTGDLTLCEGPFDAIKLWQNHIPALALGGKVLHDRQFRSLRQFSPETSVTIMLDPEERAAPFDVAEKLIAHFKKVYIARLPDGVDPGNASAVVSEEALEAAKLWKGARQDRLKAKLQELRAKTT